MTSGYDNGSSNPQKKKKIAIIGVSFVILVAMVVAVAVGINQSHHKENNPAGSSEGKGNIQHVSKSIKTVCQPTDYRETCEQTLNKAAGNITDPRELVKASFNIAIEALKEAIVNSSTIRELAKDPMARQALENCHELMNNAIADLKESFAMVESFQASKLNEYVTNLKVWLSATMTYQQTCLDGFKDTKGPAGDKMKEILMFSSQLTSNGLAMVTGLSSIVKDYMSIAGLSRRLLAVQDEFPSWITDGKRKLLQAAPAEIKPDAVVAQDGSGQFKTINEAVQQIPTWRQRNNQTYVLYIKEGVYEEQVDIPRSLAYLTMIGDGPTRTKITGKLNFAHGTQTYKTSTVTISGDHFMAKDIGFENSAGAIGHQAVALRVQSDMSIFYNCRMDGYQDTLYAHAKRQFYRDCTITGTIDFIFGNAVAVFQNCNMVVRKPLDNQQCIVTAHGRNETRQPTGFVLQNCTITADPEYHPVRFTNKAYLGRPWKEFSRTIIMQSEIDDLISPEGWMPWMGTFGLDTLFYSEYNNRGPGAAVDKRVTWQGIKKITPEEADGYTAANFLGGDEWIPPSGVPYTPGMMNV